MIKKVDNLPRVLSVPSVGTDIMLPASIPPIFPAISCKEAEIIFKNFEQEKSIGKEGLSLLGHLYDFEGSHDESCPYKNIVKDILAARIRTYFNFD